MERHAWGLHENDGGGLRRAPERIGTDDRLHTILVCRSALRQRRLYQERYEGDPDQEPRPSAIEYVWGRHVRNVCLPSRRATSVAFDSAATGLPAGIVYT